MEHSDGVQPKMRATLYEHAIIILTQTQLLKTEPLTSEGVTQPEVCQRVWQLSTRKMAATPLLTKRALAKQCMVACVYELRVQK